MEEVDVKMVSMTIHACAMLDIWAKTAKLVSYSYEVVASKASMIGFL